MRCRLSVRGKAGLPGASGGAMCSSGTLRGGSTQKGPSAAARGSAPGRGQDQTPASATSRLLAGRGRVRRVTDDKKSRALAEMALCEQVLAKAGLNVLLETFRDAGEIKAWEHYPPGDIFDPQSGAQWFYHCHPAEEGAVEHGHFHCFVRPAGLEGPIHHLAAIGVDAYGRLLRLFTVNNWVVDDNWLDAEQTIALLPCFNVEMPRPSYLVNRWLTAIFAAYEDEIAALIRERDRAIAAQHPADGSSPLKDRALEITSAREF